MARIETVEMERVVGPAKALLDEVNKGFGMVPNLMRTLAHSPAALQAYMTFLKTLGGGKLSGALREQIAITVANENACQYCAAGHTALGKRFGLDAAELRRNLEGESTDPKVEAALQFAQAVVARRGQVTDKQLECVRQAGYGDGEIVEIIGTVVLTIFSNYVVHVADIELDFPAVDLATPAAV